MANAIKIKTLLFIYLFLVCQAQAQKSKQNSRYPVKTLQDSFISLDQNLVETEDSSNSLKPLYYKIHDKKIVAIGEATHGTHEIRKIQLTIAKGLVKNVNFKMISLGETGLLESYPLYDFVVNGNGNIHDLTDKQHYNMSDFLGWLSEYNQTKNYKQKIWLLGTGTDSPEIVLNFIEKHFKTYEINNSKKHIDALRQLFANPESSNEKSLDTLKKHTNSLTLFLNSQKGFSDSLNFKVECMLKSIETLSTFFIKKHNSLALFQIRDKIIFNNLTWLFELRGKTVILFAHNLHVNKVPLFNDYYSSSTKPFGAYLSETFSNDYLSIGTETMKGVFYNSHSARNLILEDKNKLGNIIGSFTPNNFGLVLFSDKLRNALNSYDLKITNGTAKSELVTCKGNLGNAFDGIIYIKKSSPYQRANFYTLFLNLSEQQSEEILSKRMLEIRANISHLEKKSSVKYRIYLHDKNKNLLSDHTSYLNNSLQNLSFPIPKNAKFLSISLHIQNCKYFKIEEFTVNGFKQNLKHFSLHDWNKQGYKIKQTKEKLSVSKATAF